MNGIYYIASGEKYFNEVLQAIEKTKKVMPNIQIALCTDEDVEYLENVDFIIKMDKPMYNFADKVCNYMKSPFDNTIFLDTDTYLLDSIEGLFVLLDRFDVAAPHAPIEEDEFVKLTDAFAEMNSGVIAYRRNAQTEEMFKIYEEHYLHSLQENIERYGDIPPDQPSFRYAVFYSSVNFAFLPHEYNCMLDFPCFLSGRVHILHGHYDVTVMEKKGDIINKITDYRLYSPTEEMIY